MIERRARFGCPALPIVLALLAIAPALAEGAGRPVSLTAADGVSLAGLFYEAPNRPAPGVVLVHMLGRSKDDWAAVASRLQASGLNVLAIDLRGHGQSSGSAASLEPMIGDVSAAVDWLVGRPAVRADRVAIAGASLGANLALLAAVERPIVHALALLSPSLDYRGVRISAALLKRFGAHPVWLVASTADPYALRTIRELATDTSGPRDEWLTTVPAHGTRMLTADPSLVRELVDWLRRTLIF